MNNKIIVEHRFIDQISGFDIPREIEEKNTLTLKPRDLLMDGLWMEIWNVTFKFQLKMYCLENKKGLRINYYVGIVDFVFYSCSYCSAASLGLDTNYQKRL